jgi:hypothetical protein
MTSPTPRVPLLSGPTTSTFVTHFPGALAAALQDHLSFTTRT